MLAWYYASPLVRFAREMMSSALVDMHRACVTGGGAGGHAAPYGSRSSSTSGTAGPSALAACSDDRKICLQCHDVFSSAHGHVVHCATSRRCKGAASMPLAEYHALHADEVSRTALRKEAAKHFLDNEASIVNHELQDMYYDTFAPGTTVAAFKSLLKDHDERCAAELIRRLGEGRSAAEVESLQQEVADIFRVSTCFETDTQLRDRTQPTPAICRELVDRPDAQGNAQGPRTGDHVYDIPICDGLAAIVRDNPSVIDQWREQMAGWHPEHGESITLYADITDGSYFQNHPELGRAADWSDGVLRIACIVYYDEVECVNAIGQFTGTHKIGLFYWVTLNYGPNDRMDLTNIHLATVVLDADVSYYGIEQIVSGPPNEPNWAPDGKGGSSIGASFRALHAGIDLLHPSAGTFVPVPTRGWLVVVSADNPAAALLTGTMVGTAANRFCRQCTVDRRTKGFDAPCSFVDHTQPSPALRTQEDRRQDMEVCGNCEEDMASAGWKSWSHAFTRCGPYFDFLTCLPEDMMHDEYEGIVKGEVAQFIFYGIRVQNYFTLDDLNQQLNTYIFPGSGNPIPYFTDSCLTGDTAKKVAANKAKKAKTDVQKPAQGDPRFVPKAGAHVHMTAGQMATFTTHSPQIFLELGVPADDAAYLCWLDHVKYLQLLMQHSISSNEVHEIDRLITKHQKGLRVLSKIYPNIWKPKHHYGCHFPLDIQHFGPPRHYWCMRFEAMNQIFKKIAIGGSYRDTTRRLAQFWAVRSALARQNMQPFTDLGSARATTASEVLTFSRTDAPPHVQDAIECFDNLFGSSVTTTYVTELQVDGRMIVAGTSWLLLTLDVNAEPVLASVLPLTGIFTVDSGYYFQVVVHHGITIPKATPMRTINIPAASELTPEIISLDEILEMKVLWPAKYECSADVEKWTFVQM